MKFFTFLHVKILKNEGIEMENEDARRKIRTKLFNNLVDDGDDDVNMSATVHQIVELCAWRGERVYTLPGAMTILDFF